MSKHLRFEPHSHTMYSNIRLIDSINKPKDLIDRAIENGLSGIAITDHEALCCHIEVNSYAQELVEKYPDFKVALGNEIYLTDDREPGQKYYHFILIAKDAIGHKQLRILSSLAWNNSYVDRRLERVPTLKSDLEEIILREPGHLIATTACLGGELSSLTLELLKARQINDFVTEKEKYDKIINFLKMCQFFFKEDFYIECAPGKSKEQIAVNIQLKKIAQAFNIKMVIGTDAHFLKKEDRYVHKSYLNSKEGDREVDAFYEFSYLQTNEEILENLSPSFNEDFIYEMFMNSQEIWDKIERYDLRHPQVIPSIKVKNYLPKYSKEYNDELENMSVLQPTLYHMFQSDNAIERYWVNQCCDKLKELGKYNKIYLDRLEEEADIKYTISKALGTNMFAYPVTLQHYIDMFWECGSMVGAGRGSSCSGLNHYLLGVTQLDPIEWDLPFWRYLNKDRIELGDIDLDLCPSKRPYIIHKIKEERGANMAEWVPEWAKKEYGCTLVATFGTETSKSAILTACRGYRSEDYPDGIDNDTAQYLSSLVPEERGFIWSIEEVYYGNEEKDRKAVSVFKNEVDKYPGLLDIMIGIEGLVSRRGSHASGVILFDEDPFKFGCFMKTPSGDTITQYDLHMAEAAGMTKYDFLLTEVQDKIVQCIEFMQNDGLIDKDLSLREVYDKYLHPNVLPLNREDVWSAIQNNEVLNIFQFDSMVGSQAAKKIKPNNILELADANGLMRLMTAEKGQENPIDKYVRYKNNISLWKLEMDSYGLTDEEQEIVKPYFEKSYGVPPSQEQMMQMLMDPGICGFSLKDANAARKIVGKKQMAKIPALHQQVIDQGTSEAMSNYIWECGIGPQMGYSFSIIHALAYSFIGYQTAYLATNWNPVYWDAACLVVNSASLEEDDSWIEDEEAKKKNKGAKYDKIAKAIGDIMAKGIKISLVNINTSTFGFKPDAENNRILYGLKPLSGINNEIYEKIIAGRPYKGIKDFMNRCPLSKSVMFNLIKAGAFDEIDKDFGGDRKQIMAYYVSQVCGMKKRLTLQNFNGLIQHGVIPMKDLEMQVRIFNFTKYLKAYKKVGKYYVFDDACENFFNRFLTDYNDYLQVINGLTCILQDDWKKIYNKFMSIARDYLKAHQEEMLNELNKALFKELWNDKCSGSLSHWEMDALCFYYHEHELANVNMDKYGLVDYAELDREPIVDYFFKRKNAQIPIYKLFRIIGTVIAKNDSKSTVTILTTSGVVNVKFTREYYAMFKKQISEMQEDGHKKVMEKGWFSRGNMIMVTGFRREDTFVAKTYKNTATHQLYKITKVEGDEIQLQHERYTSSTSYEEDEYEYGYIF